jgi:hypothetical protein
MNNVDIIAKIKKDLEDLSDPAKAEFLPRFFKTLPGGYAAGDVFVGCFRSQCSRGGAEIPRSSHGANEAPVAFRHP